MLRTEISCLETLILPALIYLVFDKPVKKIGPVICPKNYLWLFNTTMVIYKKFLEELIAYFPWYDMGHIENDASNNSSIVSCVFVTAVTFLANRCLTTIGGFLPSRYLATINGFLPRCCLATTRGIDRHTHSNVISKPTFFSKWKKYAKKRKSSLNKHQHRKG
jgi:hypothetical protein